MKSIKILFFIFLVLGYIPVSTADTLTNGGFESNYTGWTWSGSGTYELVSPGYEGNNTLRIIVDGAGTTDQWIQTGFTLYPYTSYRFSVVANSTLGNDIYFSVNKNSNPATNFGLDENSNNLTPTLQRFTYNFVTKNFASTTTDTRLRLYIGNYGGSMESYYFDSVSLEKYYIPPTPTNLTATQSNFWINYTWDAGTGNTTDGYNVSVNGTWINGTSAFNNITLPAHGWSNITVYAWNSSAYNGTLSNTSTSLNTQLDNNPVTLSNISDTYTINTGELLQIFPTASDLDNDVLVFATSASNGTFYTNNGTLEWIPQAGDNGTYNWLINVTDDNGSTDTINFAVSVNSSIPGTPLDLVSSQGNFWINNTWNISANTDGFNVSVNDIWINGTTSTFNNTTVSPHNWSNITVYGYNNTDDSLGNSTSLNTQLDNNLITIANTSISSVSITTAQDVTISVNMTDLDNDNISNVIVGITATSLGGSEVNYTMTQVSNTSIYNYTFGTATPATYTVTHFYGYDGYENVSQDSVLSFSVSAPTVTSNPSSGGGGSSGSSSSNSTGITYVSYNVTWQLLPSTKIEIPIIMFSDETTWTYNLSSNLNITSSESNTYKSKIIDHNKIELSYFIGKNVSSGEIYDVVRVRNENGEYKDVSIRLSIYRLNSYLDIPPIPIPFVESSILDYFFEMNNGTIVGIRWITFLIALILIFTGLLSYYVFVYKN